MGVRIEFDDKGLRNKLQALANLEDEIQDRITAIAEDACTHARTVTPNHQSGGYNDQTGNLRSSIGFAIFHNGQLLKSGGFKTIGSGSDGEANAKRAIDAIEQKVTIPNTGWLVIVVAGMNYASFVEFGHTARNGRQIPAYNVLALTEPHLKQLCEDLATSIAEKIRKIFQ